ncbi:CmcI family methyltransferase [Paraburkholderia bannensis]|uniref:CmcI family methyltransferase n=1 Tax=Paraburkholderia bannensis TaxID=765414 RepID=UPI002AB6807B|nr:CmcI family methyltransferase [Paraburkholderia bannensis]
MLIPDYSGEETQLWQCLACYAHVPQSAPRAPIDTAIASQTSYHERLWETVAGEEMSKLRADLNAMVVSMSEAFGCREKHDLIVELGAGRGGLVRALLDQGYNAVGCEPSERLIGLARKYFELDESHLLLKSAGEFLSELKVSNVRPKTIVLWHVLEHLSRPLNILADCMDLVGDSGSLILQLPLLDSQYLFPEHYFFVTPETLAYLASELGEVSFRYEIDYENKYITAFFGLAATRGRIVGDGKLVSINHLSAKRALSEPTLTRDAAIAGLVEQRRLAADSLLRVEGDLAQLEAELSRAKADQVEASKQCEWAQHSEATNVAIIAKLNERVLALSTLAEQDAARVEDTQREVVALNAEIERCRNEVSLREASEQATAEKLKLCEQEVAAVERQLVARGEQVAQKVREMEALARELSAARQAIDQKNEVIAGQARMIEQRWDAMQQMGQEIHRRDKQIDQLADLLKTNRELLEEARGAELNTTQQFDARLGEAARANDQLRSELGLLQHSLEQREEVILAQNRMIDERWSAMQEMGREISRRDERIQGQRNEIDELSTQARAVYLRYHEARQQYADLTARMGESTRRGARNIFAKWLPSRALNLGAVSRSQKFSLRQHNRYWWHRTDRTDYVPLIYSFLDSVEWNLLEDWFETTGESFENTGEANIPPMSMLFGIISGNGLKRIVQCGHYVGYSTLLMGFLLRRMGCTRALYSIDVDREVTAFTRSWVKRAGLTGQVTLSIADSASPHEVEGAREYLGGAPQLVFIDSSHEYAHTLRELDLWYAALEKGGFIVLHDTSMFAASLDRTESGGVRKALLEWCDANAAEVITINGFVDGGHPGQFPYLDGCGLSIIQKI